DSKGRSLMRRTAHAVSLVFVLGLAAPVLGQDELDKGFKWIEDQIKRIEDGKKKSLEQSAAELREIEKGFETLFLASAGEGAQKEERFRAAAEAYDKAIAALEAKRRSPLEQMLYGLTLLRAGKAYSDMGEPDLACARAKKAWEQAISWRS